MLNASRLWKNEQIVRSVTRSNVDNELRHCTRSVYGRSMARVIRIETTSTPRLYKLAYNLICALITPTSARGVRKLLLTRPEG